MTEKKPARRSAERETMKQKSLGNPIKSIISSEEIPVNEIKEIGLCRFWGPVWKTVPIIKMSDVGTCVIAEQLCFKRQAFALNYLRCRTYQSWLAKQNV